MKKIIVLLIAPIALAACSPTWDMHGVDPQKYYEENPIENKVEMRTHTYKARFEQKHSHLAHESMHALRASLRTISPYSIETIQVQMHRSDLYNSARKAHLEKLMRQVGYNTHLLMFEPSDVMARNMVRIDIVYAAVISPRCPDWRTSPITTYSNTSQAGYGCATVNNLGLMVADPRDLKRGQGINSPDPERNSVVLGNYRTNEGAGEDAATSAVVNTTTSASQ